MEATLRKRLTEARHTLHKAHFWKPAGSFSIVLFLVIALIAWKVHGTSSPFHLVPAFILAVWIGGLGSCQSRSA